MTITQLLALADFLETAAYVLEGVGDGHLQSDAEEARRWAALLRVLAVKAELQEG